MHKNKFQSDISKSATLFWSQERETVRAIQQQLNIVV